MDTSEIVVWSVMLGGLLTLVTAFTADVLMNRNIAAWRGLAFVVLSGTSCLLMTGLPELLFPDIPKLAVQILKSGLGPLSGALALSYLGLWLGESIDDWAVRASVRWGPPVLIAATVLVIAVFLSQTNPDPTRLVAITAPISGMSVILATVASVRSARLGDQLAHWMVVACFFLAVMVGGLYTRDLMLAHFGLGALIFISFSTVAFFLVVGVSIAGNFFAAVLAKWCGYRRAIAWMFAAAFLSMMGAFGQPHGHRALVGFWFPLVGFFSGVFGLFTMYLPPLFPVLLRTTGAGFSYNIGRIGAAVGTVVFGLFSRVGDFRLALLCDGALFAAAALVALFLPDGEPEDD